MARLQATIPDPLYARMERLGRELGLSVSEVGAEACSLFAAVVAEVKRGRRMAFVHRGDEQVREFSTPTLSAIEQAVEEQERMVLPDADFDRLQRHLEAPPSVVPGLQALARRRRQRSSS
jgi:Protein of unknown function (DUF1778)